MNKKLLFLLIFFIPLTVNAVSFNFNNILSDNDLTNYASMSLNRVTSFLNTQNGVLSSYTTRDIDNKTKSAAEIIYNAAQKYLLSPKFLLVTIQKESSLVTSSSASQHLLDYALGFGCPDGGSCSGDYSGFAKQVNAAAHTIRDHYLADLTDHNSTVSGWGVGKSKTALDGVTVTPENKATAVLYTYTPWIGYYSGNTSNGGNSLFWDIWQNWFGSSEILMYYPSGTLLQSRESGIIYIIKSGSKMAFTSRAALMANYNINKTIIVNEEVLDQYDDGASILFPNYTLLQAPTGGIYLYVNGYKRAITSMEIFRNLGYNPEEVLNVKWSELQNIPDAAPVSETDVYPEGVLLQDNKTGSIVYLDENNVKHEVWSKEIIESRYKGMPIFTKSTDDLKKFDEGSPTTFANGELITSKDSKKVYLIDNGKKRPFKNAKVFKKLGYQWKNIIYTSDILLDLHPNGKIVNLKNT